MSRIAGKLKSLEDVGLPSSTVKESGDKDEELMFILNHAGCGGGCLRGGLGFLRLAKLVYMHVPVCCCYRQMFPVSSGYYAFSGPCAALEGA